MHSALSRDAAAATASSTLLSGGVLGHGAGFLRDSIVVKDGT